MTDVEKLIAKLIDEKKITGEQAVSLIRLNKEQIDKIIEGTESEPQKIYLEE